MLSQLTKWLAQLMNTLLMTSYDGEQLTWNRL